jgi:outer membrane protein assembly factor BamB
MKRLVALAAAALIAGGCSGTTSTSTTVSTPGAATPQGEWPYPNGDLSNTRIAPGARIDSANVATLHEAWSFGLSGTAAAGVDDAGAFTAIPVVTGGIVYMQDQDANVYAVSLATGKLLWEYQVNVPEKTGPGPDGVAVADGVVYGDSSSAVFALNARTGKTIWADSSLLATGQGSFEIQPQVAGGRVYIASAYGSGPGGGVLMALNAETGHQLWTFNSVIGPEPGVTALGVGAGGAWETPLVNSDGSVTFGVGNPYQYFSGAVETPARMLYTDSAVNLDAATGKLRWYYQAVPNDFEDHDLQASPISTTIGGLPVIITGGKVGIVYALNARTGALLWKTPVGEHNGHDNDSLLLLEHKLKVTLPYTMLPGSLGGVLSNMALADGTVYVATLDVPIIATSLNTADGNKGGGSESGEIEALNTSTGKVEWDTKVSSLPLGATTVSRDLIFTTLESGKLIALDRTTGAVVYTQQLPRTTNAPIAVFGNTVLIPDGGPGTSTTKVPELIAYTIR